MVGLARNFVRMMRAGLHTRVLRPIRRTRLAKREQPFTHRTPHGLVFHLDPTDWICQQIYVDGVYDGRFLDWITRTLDRRGTCLDIGANIGNHGLFLARAFSPVYAIEPNPTAYAQLERNIQANPTLDVRAFQVALSDSSGDALFYDIGSGHLGLSGFAADLTHLDVSRFDYQERRVPHMTGDTLVNEEGIANIALIKIDTEGHEERVIRGLARTIGRDTPVLAFEWHGQFRPRGALAPIRELLDGYSLYEFDALAAPGDRSTLGRTLHRLKVGYETRLAPVGVEEPRSYDNILAIHMADKGLFGLE